jgi:hypothetical protein
VILVAALGAVSAGASSRVVAHTASAAWTVAAPGGGLVPQNPDCPSKSVCYALVTDEATFSAANGGTGVIATVDGGKRL